ncbi:MAG: L,D-transpeptidase [Methylocystis sp.]|nr:MAG: L,D-transpeptidase [Methylocystis sp.]
MQARKHIAHVSVSVAAFAAALFAQPASADPRRAELFAPPAAVALSGLTKAPADASLDPLAWPDAPPVVALSASKLRLQPAEPDSLDLAWALLDDGAKALAANVQNWANAPEVRDPARRAMRASVARAYVARGFAPFWIDGSGWKEGAASAMERLRLAGDDALDLRGLTIPAVDNTAPAVADELALTEAVAVYASQARGGRLQPERLSHLIGARTTLADPGQTVTEVAAAGYRAGETLQGFNPPHFGYQQLREKLIELRGQHAGLPAAAEQVASAQEGVTDALPATSKARKRREAVGGASNASVEAEIVANMERWRWLPRDMGDQRIEVNIPDFELALIRNGAVAHRTRVIVGKVETPTPVFSDEMVEIIVNPSWYVPQSIIQKEWHGGVGAGYQVSHRNGQMVVRQPPGEKNALGRVKFVFPNDYAVYMHDTPSRGLFAASHRAFSHGCMRVQEPFALAGAVLGPESGWSEARVKKLIGPSERYINLTRPLPVHVVYFTAYVDDAGRLVQRPDLYGYSARVRKALGLGG